MFSPFDVSDALICFTDVYDCEQWINTMGPGLGPHPPYLDTYIKLLFCTDGFPAFNYPVKRLSYDIILWCYNDDDGFIIMVFTLLSEISRLYCMSGFRIFATCDEYSAVTTTMVEVQGR